MKPPTDSDQLHGTLGMLGLEVLAEGPREFDAAGGVLGAQRVGVFDDFVCGAGSIQP